MTKLRRWAGPLLATAAFGAALFFTPALWVRMDGWIQNQRDKVWEQFETIVGRKVVYDRIAPSVLAALDFQNVRLLADDGSPILTAASIRLSLDWWQLLQGKGADALRRVQVINASALLDDARDRQLLEHWASFVGTGKNQGFHYQIEGFNLTVKWTDGQRSLSLDRGFVVLTPQNGEWGLRFRGALAWQDKKAQTWASGSVHGDLRSDADFQNWSLRTQASQVKTSWLDLEPLTVQIASSPEQMTFAKVADRIPLDLQAVWDRLHDTWSFRGAAEGFRPSRFVHLKGLRTWAGLAEGTVTGQFAYQPGGELSFSGQGDWAAGTWPAPFDQDAISIRGSVRTSAQRLLLDGFHWESSLVSAEFEGAVGLDGSFPEGTLRLNRLTLPGVGRAAGTLALSREGSHLVFTGTSVQWNGLSSDLLNGWLETNGQVLNLHAAGPLAPEGSRFSADATIDLKTPRFDGQVSVVAVPLPMVEDEVREHAPIPALPSLASNLVADADARVVWSPEGWEVSQGHFAFSDPTQPGHRVKGGAEWKDQTLSVDVDALIWDTAKGSGKLMFRFGADAFDWSASGLLWDRPVSLQGRWVSSDRTLVFSGQPGVEGTLHQDAAGVWTAQMSLSPYELIPGWTVGFRANATYDAGQWALNADRLTLSSRYPWNQEAFSVSTSLRADAGFVRFDALQLDDSRGRLVGSAVSSWSTDWSTPWAGRLSLSTSETSRESVTLDWVGTAIDHWHLSTRVAGLDVTRVPGAPVQGRLALTGTAEWQGTTASWSALSALSEARWGDSPLGFRAALSGTLKSISVRALSLSVNSLRVSDGSADLDTVSRSWKASLGLGLRVGAGDWQSLWSATGSWTPPEVPLRTDFRLSIQRNLWQKKNFGDSGLSGYWSSQGWEAALTDGGLRVKGTNEGAFTVKAQAPFPVQADATGSWTATKFLAQVTGFRADLGLVKEVINSPLFSVVKGFATGDFVLSGALVDPEVNGRLVLRGLSLQSSFVRQTVGPIDVPVFFEGHQVKIEPVNVAPDGQTWLLSGLARLDHLVPEEFQFSVQTDALSLIPVSYQYTGLSASGSVSGLLVVKGTPLAVTLSGRLILQDTTIALKQTQGSGEGSLGFNADLTLVTGRKVEFLWPNETLPLLRAVTASNQNLVIRANDVASTWSVTGKMALRTGEINYLSRTFVLKEGQLVFQEGQNGFDPRIQVRAEYKVRETTGDIIISLRADGTLSRFSPRFDAVPYQSPEDLQRLVGSTLALPTDYSKATSLDTAVSLASDVGTSFLLTPFEETVKKNFQLDLFTVKTEILKKSLLSRNGPLEASDYLDNTRLFFGKYIGDDLFLQGTLAFRRDGSVATQVSPKMVVEPEFQMEFQTPFFLLNWTLLPLHPETLFVTDNTVTFRWNWSY